MIKIAIGKSINSNSLENKNLSYIEFKELLTGFEIKEVDYFSIKQNSEDSKSILKHEDAISKVLKAAKSTLPWFIAGHFNPSIRKEKNLLFRSLIVLDVDKYNDNLTALEKALESDLSKYKYLAYSTTSHTTYKPKIRIIVFIKENIDIKDYANITRNFVNNLSFKEAIDEASYKPNQPMYLSAKIKIINLPEDIQLEEYRPWIKENDASLLNPKEFNQIQMPLSVNIKKLKAYKSNMDSLPKGPIISDDTITSFLEKYPAKNLNYQEWLEVGMAIHNQYHGTNKGFNIWDNWSSTDKSRYQLKDLANKWNSFELNHPRPKTFASIPAFKEKTGNSRSLALELIDRLNQLSSEEDITKVINILADNLTENESSVFLKKIQRNTGWTLKILIKMLTMNNKQIKVSNLTSDSNDHIYPLNKALPKELFDDYLESNKKPRPTYSNFSILLRSYDIKIRYNMISKNNEILIPKQTYSQDNETNASYADIISVCELNDIGTQHIGDYILKAGDLNKYDPIDEFINSNPWDGITRTSALYNTIEARESLPLEIKELLIKKWLISGVAALREKRFYSKGVLILQGEQSLGKTAWLKKLLPQSIAKYFKEGCSLDPSNKDSVRTAISHFIVELGELDSTLKKDVSILKAFITNEEDVFRAPYARNDSRFSRRTIFCGSVNEEEFLVDFTGNLRFWVIPVVKIDYNHNIDMQQLWAEIFTLYEQKEIWWLSPQEEEKLALHNTKHLKKSPLEELLLEKYCITESNELDKNSIFHKSATDLLSEFGYTQSTRSQRSEMVSVLLSLGFKRLSHDKKFLVKLR